MTIDLEKVRSDTPGVKKVIHFNNAGSSFMPNPVLEAVVSHLQLESTMGGYEAVEAAHDKVEAVYSAAAKLLNCTPKEIGFLENATRAWDMVFYAIPFKPGDRILTAQAEYASNYIAYLQVAQKLGVRVDVIPNDEFGQLSLSALEEAIDDRVKLIAITHVPTNGGLVNPAAAVGKIARKAGILYLLDACQSVGQMPMDVHAIGCDMLTATGRKYLRGPRGTGLLYVKQDLISQLEPPFLDLHAAEWVSKDKYTIRSDARRFENWETNYAGKIGLGAAINYALDLGLESVYERIQSLANDLRQRLTSIPKVTVHDLGQEKCGIVTFTVSGKTPSEIKDYLSVQGINVSISIAAYSRLDMEARNLPEIVRASVHYYNTEEEIERFCKVLSTL